MNIPFVERNNLKLSNIDKRVKIAIQEKTNSNKLIWTAPSHNRRENVHSFFQYPAMMVPSVQKELIGTLLQIEKNIKFVLDFYMGSATTLVASMFYGLNCYGQDINPLAILIAKVKTGPYLENAFKNKSEILFEQVYKDSSNKIAIEFKGLDKWFTSDVTSELSKLHRAIKKEKNIHTRRFFWVTLAETVRLTSNDRTSTFKLHSRPKEEIAIRNVSPIETFFLSLEKNLDDLKDYKNELEKLNLLNNGYYKGKIKISLNDSTKNIVKPRKLKFDLLISSPPYGDNKTTIPYGQHAFLPLQWIDLKDIDKSVDKTCLKTTSEIDNRSIGGSQKKISKKKIDFLLKQSPTLNEAINLLNKKHSDKINKIINFIYDLDISLKICLQNLNDNAYLIFTIGNRRVGGKEIKNAEILKELLLRKNVILVTEIERKILNKRMPKKNNHSKTMCYEKILIFRKIG